MPWLKLDDAMGEHRKTRRLIKSAGLAPLGLHALAMLHAARYMTDGFVDEDFVAETLDDAKVKGQQRNLLVTALVQMGQWEQVDGGWLLHDFLEYNPSRAQTEHHRTVDAYRKELSRDHALTAAIRDRDGSECRYCGLEVNWNDRRSKTGGTYDHVVPVSYGGLNSFENVVVACRGCNQRKGCRTPDEAGMVLAPAKSGPEPGQNTGKSRGKSFPSPVPTRPVPVEERDVA